MTVKKTPAEREMNGNPSRRPMPQVALEGSHLPVGAPPKGMPKEEQAAWNRLSSEMMWLNWTNRSQMEAAAKAAVRFYRLDRFFAGRRAAMKKRGDPEVYAELNDERTRAHPLMAQYRDARDAHRQIIGNLGGSPVVQSRMLDFIDASMRKHAKREKEEAAFLT